jgi:polysaccharide biosynthesis/export protein
LTAAVVLLVLLTAPAQTPAAAVPSQAPPTGGAPVPAPPPATGVTAAPTPPPGYVIGIDDVLSILFWREKDLSGDVTVRPDGKITLPLLNEIQAAGLTPEQLRTSISAGASRFIADPSVTVVVRQINSRRVFLVGQVPKPGPYPLTGPTTVLQLLSMAGGILEYADQKNIIVTRTENGSEVALRFNYKDALKGRNLKQNVELKPGDTILVP